LLWLLNSCTIPLFPGKEIDIQLYLDNKPIAANNHFSIHRLPPGYDAEEILNEVTLVGKSVRKWLKINPPSTPDRIVILSADEPDGQSLLGKNLHRHQVTGQYLYNNSVLLVTGQVDDPRFLTVLRHEAVHAALNDAQGPKDRIPFWLNEGIATFFEQGANVDIALQTGNERLKFLQYHLARGELLDFAELIDNPVQAEQTGKTYARSWGLIACLYFSGRPIQQYLRGLSQESVNQRALFKQTLLLENESIKNFETTCSQWFLNSANTIIIE